MNDQIQIVINNSFHFQNVLQKSFIVQKKSKHTLNPRLSILPSSIDSQKSKLQIYKQHFLNIQLKKQAVPKVPEPSVVLHFKVLKQRKSLTLTKQKLKKQLQKKREQYQKLKRLIDKYSQIYESKEESIKQKVLLSKILSTKLETQFQKTKEKFRQLQFSKIINIAQKKLYFYQLAQIFFNQHSRNVFSFEKERNRTDQEMGICLGYLGFLISSVARISGVQMWIKFKFRGHKSTISIYDPKVIESISSSSSFQNSNLVVIEQTFLLHPKEPRLNQALGYLSEQLKQIMKYNLGISMGKSNNFYELCQELSKFLLNI